MQAIWVHVYCGGVLVGWMAVRDRIARVSVVIEVEQEVPIRLAVDGLSNCCHVVEDNHCIQ